MKKDLLIIIIGSALLVVVWIGWSQFAAVWQGDYKRDGGPVACTADAMQCPDGTWIGRTGPDCEFVCP